MSIVVITIPGNAQREFVNALHAETKGAVKLVIIQVPEQVPLKERITRFYRRTKDSSFLKEMWYALLLRLSARTREALSYFQAARSDKGGDYQPKIMRTNSVNSDEVFQELQSLAPTVLAVWGSTVLEPRVLATAKSAVNLHFGLSPHYRGALANQHAVLNDDFAHVGATIHYIDSLVDGGDILDQVRIDSTLPPREAFRGLTTDAPKHFIEVIKKLYAGETLPVRVQDTRDSKVLLLRQWLPSKRYAVGTRITALEGKKSSSTFFIGASHRFAVGALIALTLSVGGYALVKGL